jgi:hypothetical protein
MILPEHFDAFKARRQVAPAPPRPKPRRRKRPSGWVDYFPE